MSWKTLTSKVVFDNPWMTVLEDRVVNPGGGKNNYGHIRFKNRAIAIVPLDEDGNTWLVGQDRYTLGMYSWELPMGGGALDEDPLLAAQRELREETGLTARDWQQVMFVHTTNSITNEEGFVYVARDLTPGKTEFEQSEELEIRQLPLAEAVAMATDGRITDLMSVAALLRVASL